MSLSIGIDIGGTNTVFGVVNEEGQILHQGQIHTKDYATANDFVQALKHAILQICEADVISNVSRIGVGAPNGNYFTGNIEHAANLQWKGIIPMANMIATQFGKPTQLTNDANAAAMGEMMYGVAKGMNDFIMVTLGTGVGSGFVANGKLIYGHDGFAGELGHVISVRDGRQCGCSRKGCLETYTSANGIVHTAQEFLAAKNSQSSLVNHGQLNAKDIYNAAVRGDELALNVFDFTGKILGQTLADAVAITSPEAIVLFGGLAQAGSFIFEPTKKYMEANMLVNYKGKVKLLASLLNESNVAILGAAALS
jgi:glucokinase